MVEHHIQNDFDPRGVQRPDHGFEFEHGIIDGIVVRRGEPSDRIVAPVVLKLAIEQKRLADKGLTGQQFHGRHAERFQMFDHRRDGQSEVGAAPFLRYGGMQPRKSLYVQFVNKGIAPRNRRRPVAIPMKRRVNDAAAQGQPARKRARVRIDQRHARIEALAAVRIIGPMDAKRIVRARSAVPRGNQAVPNVPRAAGQIVACDFRAAVGVEKADFDPSRVAREHGDVDALLGPGRAERPGGTRTDGQFRGAFKSPASPPKYGPRTRERFDRWKSNPCSSN